MNTKKKKPLIKQLLGIGFIWVLLLGSYWVAGRNFERGPDLATAVLFAGLLSALFLLIPWEDV